MPDWIEPDKPMTMELRRRGCKKTSLRYNRYCEDFLIELIDKINPDEVGAVLVKIGDLVPDKEWQIIDDDEYFWQEHHSAPEREMDLEQNEKKKR